MRILNAIWHLLYRYRRVAVIFVASLAVAAGILHVVEQNALRKAENRRVQQALDAKQGAEWAEYEKAKLDTAIAARQSLKAEHEVEVREVFPPLPTPVRKPLYLEPFKPQKAERMGSGLFSD